MSILYTNRFALFFFVIPMAQWFFEANPLTVLILFLVWAVWMAAVYFTRRYIRSRPLEIEAESGAVRHL